MSTEKRTKINLLLSAQPYEVVFLSTWLHQQGYSQNLQARYRKNKWLQSIGRGAMIRLGDKVGYEGALYALQNQADFSIHPGGRTAFSLLGKAHYLELSATQAILFGGRGEQLPAWFQKHHWGLTLRYYKTAFLPVRLGLVDVEFKTFSIKVSGAARAIMECLYLAPEKQDLLECYELMEGLNNLRPTLVQQMLEQCQSVKVKRLFLYMAEKAGHDWLNYVDLEKIDLGKGKRCIVKADETAYVKKYQITVPKVLEDDESKTL